MAEKSKSEALAPVDKHVAQVKAWANADGRHALDPYLEDVMIQRAQGVDSADDRSARIAIVAGEEGEKRIIVISTQRGVVDSIGKALASGEYKLVGKQAKRPGEEVLAQMLGDAPLPLLPPPIATTAPMPAPKAVAAPALPPKPVSALPPAKVPIVPMKFEPTRSCAPAVDSSPKKGAYVRVTDERNKRIATSPILSGVNEGVAWAYGWNDDNPGFYASVEVVREAKVWRRYVRKRSALIVA